MIVKNRPYITIGLVAVNVIVFLLGEAVYQEWHYKGNLNLEALFYRGEYYRVITSMFMHANIQHIANNMLLLGGLGAMMEREIGHIWFLVLYFATGLGGQVVSLAHRLLTNSWAVRSIGASGAIFGMIGVLLAMTIFWKRDMERITWKRVVFVIAYSLYSGLRTPNVDNAAHIGGLAAGLILGPVMCYTARRRV